MPIGLTDILESLGDFPIVEDIDFKGGYRAVADVTARDAIPTTARKVGMLVRTIATNETWILGPGITNGDWALSVTAIAAKDEGSSLTSSASSFDFVGPGVTATNLGGAVTVTVPGATGATGISYLPMAIDEGTDVRITEVAVGGLYFDPTGFTTPTVTFRLTGSYASTDVTGNAQVRLYDMGPASGPFAPVLRSTLTIPFANVDDFVKVDQALSLVASPGLGLNQIHLTARVYEVRMYLNTLDVGSNLNVAWAGFEIVGGAIGSSSIVSKNEGVSLTSTTSSFDFVGPGVTATNLGGAVTVTVPGIPAGIDATVTTNNATPTLLHRYTPTGPGRTISFNIEVLAGKTGTRAHYALLSFWSTKADSTPVLHNTTYLNGPFEQDAGWSVTLTPSGVHIDIMVTGAALTTIDWRVVGSVNEHSMAGGGDP